MTEPKNGDFASYLNQIANSPKTADAAMQRDSLNVDADQTEGVLRVSAETLADEAKLDALAEEMKQRAADLEAAGPMSDEELERQALEAGGSDGDPDTPE